MDTTIKIPDTDEMSDEWLRIILAQYAGGLDVHKICSDPRFPSVSCFRNWIYKHPEAKRMFRAVQPDHAASIFDDILYIADTELDPKRARNMMFARNLVASKYDRERFGDKVQTTIEHTININASIEQARQRMVDVTAQPIEIQHITPSITSDTISDVEALANAGLGIFSW